MCLFFFTDTATTEIYTLSLHDALPIYHNLSLRRLQGDQVGDDRLHRTARLPERTIRHPRQRHPARPRSEEHTSELQSRQYLVCRLLLEKKNNILKTADAPRRTAKSTSH